MMRSNIVRGMGAIALGISTLALVGFAGSSGVQAQSTSGSTAPAPAMGAGSTGGCDAMDSMCLYCQSNPGTDLCSIPGNDPAAAASATSSTSSSSSTAMSANSSGTDTSGSDNMGMGMGSMGSGMTSMSSMTTNVNGSPTMNNTPMVGASWTMCTPQGTGMVWVQTTSLPTSMGC